MLSDMLQKIHNMRPTDFLSRLIIFGLALLLLIQLVRLILAIITPIGPYGDWQPSAPKLLSIEERQQLLSSSDPFFPRGGQNADPVNITNMQLTLFGIRMNEGSGKGSAIIGTPDGTQTAFSVGDEIQPGVRLGEVAFDHIVISQGGMSERLYMDMSKAAPTVGSTDVPNGAEQLVRNSLSFRPLTENGSVSGIIVSPRGNSGLFDAIGFHGGDIIRKIAGKDVKSPADIDAYLSGPLPAGGIPMEVERNQKLVPIKLTFPS